MKKNFNITANVLLEIGGPNDLGTPAIMQVGVMAHPLYGNVQIGVTADEPLRLALVKGSKAAFINLAPIAEAAAMELFKQ